MQIKILRLRKNSKMPFKAHENDAGFDIFYSSEKEEVLELKPKSSTLIPTGFKIHFPKEYMVEIKNKGGIAAKRQLIVGSCVVDSSFTGEIFVNLHNIGEETQIINPGDKIAQMVPIFIGHYTELIEVTEDSYSFITQKSTRKEGCLGSTGLK